MKTQFLNLTICFLLSGGMSDACYPQGIYNTSGDFLCHRLTHDSALGSNYKIRFDKASSGAYIKFYLNSKVQKISKDSIFGIRDELGNDFRFFNRFAYKIINKSAELVLYSVTSSEPMNIRHFGSERIQVTYFFSSTLTSPVMPLTKWNLKQVFFNNTNLVNSLDSYFHDEDKLIAYDSQNQIYYINRFYNIFSK